MAPEVILGEGYTFSVDVWSIAVCLFEFICGAVPFGENCEDPMEVYISIINDDLVFPHFVKDQHYRSLMKLMMRKQPMQRLFNFNQIRAHPWWEGFNWVRILFNSNRKI
jgi:cGMP-dependent protein kinase